MRTIISMAVRQASVSKLLLALTVLVAVSCSGNEPVADPAPVVEPTATAVADVPEPTSEPTVEPTQPPATPTPVTFSDDELVEAALDAYAISDEAAGWYDWELIDTVNRSDGLIDLNLCTWDGTTVRNAVRTARVQLDTTAAPLDGILLSESVGPGRCTNNTMIATALEHAETFDRAWAAVSEEHDLLDELLKDITTQESFEAAQAEIEQRELDGVRWVTADEKDVDYPEDLVLPALQRVVGDEIQLVLCSNMDPNFGLYRNGILIDDFVPEDNGPHAISHYRIAPSDTVGDWKMIVVDGLSWANCLRVPDWPGEAQNWKPDGPTWTEWSPAAP